MRKAYELVSRSEEPMDRQGDCQGWVRDGDMCRGSALLTLIVLTSARQRGTGLSCTPAWSDEPTAAGYTAQPLVMS